MEFRIDDKVYKIVIARKIDTKNTYIRVNKKLEIVVTTNRFTSDKSISNLIDSNYKKVVKMVEAEQRKQLNNTGFYLLGKCYDIVYVDYCDISFGESKVFVNKYLDVDKWLKKYATDIFKRHLEKAYQSFSRNIPYPSLKIRKMTSRWGVCNVRLKTVTLNSELIKRDPKYLDYVIIHELSHLVEPNHSSRFWDVVAENMPDYKKFRQEMKDF